MSSVEALGLRIAVDLPVTLAGGPSDAADVHASLRPDAWPPGLSALPERVYYVDPETDEAGTPILVASRVGDDLRRLRYFDGCEFLVHRTGGRVWARWPAEVPLSETLFCLFGPVIGFVLHLRGTPCLHASAVAVNGRAVAFLGHSGAGKSTITAALVRRGYPALTDDVLALDRREGRFFVRPGHSVLRLRPDAVRGLYGSEDAVPPGPDGKRQLDLGAAVGAFQSAALPLTCIYVLEDRTAGLASAAELSALHGQAALMALVARTYMNCVLDGPLRARAFDVFATVATRIPVRRLVARDGTSELAALADAILDDLARLS